MRTAKELGRKIDLVLLDSRLGGGAFTFVEQSREMFGAVPPVVLVLDVTERPPKAETLQSFGVSAFVVKPVWRTDLEQAMLRALFSGAHGQETSQADVTVSEAEKNLRLRL
jgi:DNA-binding NarL/FixJ family response regulator